MEKSYFNPDFSAPFKPITHEPLQGLLVTLAIPLVLALLATIITLILLKVFKRNRLSDWLDK